MRAVTDRWTVEPALRVEGELAVPGDKSISHRALIVAAMGHGAMRLSGCSPAEDVGMTLRAVRSLGVRIDAGGSGEPLGQSQSEVHSETLMSSSHTRDFQYLAESAGIGFWRGPEGVIDVGNSGTTIRLLLGALAGSGVDATLTGDDSIRRRPMRRVVGPLRAMGADIDGDAGGERAPLVVRGRPLRGATHDLPVASAQVKSALLLAGLTAQGKTEVREPAASRDHTERMLRYLGVPIDMSTKRSVVEATPIQNADIDVPGDFSSAAFMLVAAAILPGSAVTIHDVGLNPTRTGILDILRAFGASVEVGGVTERCGEPRGSVTVRAGNRRPIEVAGDLTVSAMDELPLVAVLGAYAEGGVTTVTDAAELRVKESDRIAAVTAALAAMGAGVEPLPDGFAVRAGRLAGARVDPAGDHRIAMALAVAGLGASEPTEIEGWGCVGVSYPGFEQDLERLAVR